MVGVEDREEEEEMEDREDMNVSIDELAESLNVDCDDCETVCD